ncbi:MAG: ABC transporter ATP-binding protein [Acidobacteria bacterium]|nr:ABC transporter ATP-binding protein [Acidobacteriota bacterium]
MSHLLEVRDLVVTFDTPEGQVRPVDGVSLTLDAGETLSLVGESGCGKTVLALSILRLVTEPGRITSGQILWKGRDLLTLTPRQMRTVRGREIAMIFQEPMTALNPVFTVGNQIAETMVVHQRKSWKVAMKDAADLLRLVAIPDPERRVHDYPHQMSGGMRQRVLIAMALSCNPDLILADEPTTALDVTIQAQILELLDRLRQERGLAVLHITHDLGVVAEVAHRVAVMYTGRVVEEAPVTDLFHDPLHPYTLGLMASRPRTDEAQPAAARRRLPAIQGMVPPLTQLPAGCHFAPRCPDLFAACEVAPPPLYPMGPGRTVACEKYNPEERDQPVSSAGEEGEEGEDART